MPTLDIVSPEIILPQRRRIVVRITRWFANQETMAAHVVIRFHIAPPDSIFAAGVALDKNNRKSANITLLPSKSNIPFAMITCCIATERDSEFRAGLAHELQQALDIREPNFLYVRFEALDRKDVFYSVSGRLVNADKQ